MNKGDDPSDSTDSYDETFDPNHCQIFRLCYNMQNNEDDDYDDSNDEILETSRCLSAPEVNLRANFMCVNLPNVYGDGFGANEEIDSDDSDTSYTSEAGIYTTFISIVILNHVRVSSNMYMLLNTDFPRKI